MGGGSRRAPGRPALGAGRAEAIAEMVIAGLHREYPAHLLHLVSDLTDVRAPRELHPAFFGSFDWHSSVHSHWCLVRLARCIPSAAWRVRALAAVGESLAPERLAGERSYLTAPGREGFERPYGLAWLLQLAAELREWAGDAAAEEVAARQARAWLAGLASLEALAAERILGLIERLSSPVRSGEHGQTAFALALLLDWTRAAREPDVAGRVRARAREFYRRDRAAPVAYEPSGHDFLSPVLGEADLMRRVLEPGAYISWLEQLLPAPDGAAARAWLAPVASPDRADGKLAHLDGLNLSRAWMLGGIASALPGAHPWRARLAQAARRHGEAGLAAVPAEHYAGAHWLGSFAVYLLTRRGLAGVGPIEEQ